MQRQDRVSQSPVSNSPASQHRQRHLFLRTHSTRKCSPLSLMPVPVRLSPSQPTGCRYLCASTLNPAEPSVKPLNTSKGQPQRLLGVDYGTSTTGLALGQGGVSSALQTLPTPRTTSLSDVARQVVALALQHGAQGLVVGIPVQPGGSIVKPHTDSAMGHRCRNLAHSLALLTSAHGISVYLYNETGTTRAAVNSMGYNWQDRLSGKEYQAKRVDAESAAMLLRLYYGNPRLAVRVNPRLQRSPEGKAKM